MTTPWESRCFIIGEAGVNHQGDVGLALQLVDAAAAAGCDAVKFQTFRADDLAAPSAPMAEYQVANTGREEDQRAMLSRLALSKAAHYEVRDRALAKGIAFFSTAFDPASIEFLAGLDIPLWKVPSGEATNLPMLRRVAQIGKPVILSTGMCTLAESAQAVDALLGAGMSRKRLAVLHCTTDYPCKPEDVNLRAMISMGEALGLAYGYSDHSDGSDITCAAVALGARVVEKHFTLDRTLPGPDHKASLEPDALADMVRQIRRIEAAFGDGIKRPTRAELINRAVTRKSIVAARSITAGELFSAEMLRAKRPGTGISPMEWDRVIGNRANRAYALDEAIEW